MKRECLDEGTEVCVKKEEMLQLNIYNHGHAFNTMPEVLPIKEEESDTEDFLCKSPNLSGAQYHSHSLSLHAIYCTKCRLGRSPCICIFHHHFSYCSESEKLSNTPFYFIFYYYNSRLALPNQFTADCPFTAFVVKQTTSFFSSSKDV